MPPTGPCSFPSLERTPSWHLPRHLSWHRGQRTPMPCMRCSDRRQQEFGSRGLPETSAPQDCSWTWQLTWERPGTRPLPVADAHWSAPPACPKPYRFISASRIWVLAAGTGTAVLPVTGTSCAWHCFPAHQSFLPTYGNKQRALSRAGTKESRGSAPRMRLSWLLSSPFPFLRPWTPRQGQAQCWREWRAMPHPREASGRHLTW